MQQHVRAGGPDLRFGLGARGEETARALRTMPQAVRIEAFARQNGNGFDYTQPPGASRSAQPASRQYCGCRSQM